MTATRKVRKRSEPKTLPAAPWGGRELVVLHGGPRDGHWYFAADMLAEQRINQRTGRPDAYAPTGRVVAHPEYDCTGTIWQHAGATVADRSPYTSCTHHGCPNPPVKKLTPSNGGAAWLGCTEHHAAMNSALHVGLPGATSGGGWVDTTDIGADV